MKPIVEPESKGNPDLVINERCVCNHDLTEHKKSGRCRYCECDCFIFGRFVLASD